MQNAGLVIFLMTAGPFYIKCTDKAEITIGDNCFFNHNCSLTAAENIVIGNQCMLQIILWWWIMTMTEKSGKILKEIGEVHLLKSEIMYGVVQM